MLHKLTTTLSALLLAVFMVAPALAQETQSSSPAVEIPDDGYIGTLDGNDGTGADAGMACTTLSFSSGISSISDVSMDLSITHTWIGDLTVKVTSPSGTTVAPMVRPLGDGFTNPADDEGVGCCGDSSNLDGTAINFDDANGTDAETMGDLLGSDDIVTGSFFGNGDVSANSGMFSTFDGEAADGDWEVCVGDAVGADVGTFDSVSLTISGGDPPASFTIDADPEMQTVSAPGTASFTYVVCNNTAGAASGQVFYDAGFGPVTVMMGSLPAMSCSPTLSFSIGVPGIAPPGTYNVAISAGPSLGTAVATDDVEVTVAAARVAQVEMTKEQAATLTVERPAVELAPWTLIDAQPWPALEAAARTTEIGTFPNPFVDRTEISFSLESASEVSLVIYDVRGREIATLVDDTMEAGQHNVTFDAASLPSGVYVYRLQAGTQVETGRMTLLQ